MKLGPELCKKVNEVPDMYKNTFREVIQNVREQKQQAYETAAPDELLGIQKSLQTLTQLEKVLSDASKEAELYRT